MWRFSGVEKNLTSALRLLCVLKSSSKLWFALREVSHLLKVLGSIMLLKRKKKIRIISLILVSLRFIFEPKSHNFHLLINIFSMVFHIYQKLVKKEDFCVTMIQKIQKFNKFRFSCMSLAIQNCKFLKILIGKLPRVYCMYEKNRKNWVKMSEKVLIQPRIVRGVIFLGEVIFHYKGYLLFYSP